MRVLTTANVYWRVLESFVTMVREFKFFLFSIKTGISSKVESPSEMESIPVPEAFLSFFELSIP